MRAPVQRGTLSWAAVLVVVDLGVWLLAALWRSIFLPAAVLVAWTAASLLGVAGLYLAAAMGGRNPGPVMKGARLPWLQPLFWPYRAVAWLVFAGARLLRREEVVCEVAPGIFLGPRLFPGEAALLSARGVRWVVDLAAELPVNAVLAAAPFERIEVPVLDRTVPDAADLERVIAWVERATAAGGGVFVHCAFGRGRSALVACAVLLAAGHARDPADAVARVTRARPSVQLRGVQYDVLVQYHARRAVRPPSDGG